MILTRVVQATNYFFIIIVHTCKDFCQCFVYARIFSRFRLRLRFRLCRSSPLDSSGEGVRRRFRPDESDMLVD
jgi:hypothetical protein